MFESQDFFSNMSNIVFTIQWTKWLKTECFKNNLLMHRNLTRLFLSLIYHGRHILIKNAAFSQLKIIFLGYFGGRLRPPLKKTSRGWEFLAGKNASSPPGEAFLAGPKMLRMFSRLDMQSLVNVWILIPIQLVQMYLFKPRGYASCQRFCELVFDSQDIFSHLSKIAFAIQWLNDSKTN